MDPSVHPPPRLRAEIPSPYHLPNLLPPAAPLDATVPSSQQQQQQQQPPPQQQHQQQSSISSSAAASRRQTPRQSPGTSPLRQPLQPQPRPPPQSQSQHQSLPSHHPHRQLNHQNQLPQHQSQLALPAARLPAQTPPAAQTVQYQPNTSPARTATAAASPSADPTCAIADKAASLSISSSVDAVGPGSRTAAAAAAAGTMDYKPHNGDLDGDITMEDQDPFNQAKYRPAAATSSASSSRPQSQYLPAHLQDDAASRTATRYSPMTTAPTTPYHSNVSSPPQPLNHYTSYTPQQTSSARHSPSRQNQYTSPTQAPPPQQQQRYYASPPSASRAHTSQLPPLQANPMSSPASYYPQSATQQLNAVFGHDMDPSKNSQPAHVSATSGDAVPQFTPVRDIATLQPRINAQPPFRRANPEGGFISPLQALTTHLPATYRICNPTFQYESSRNPRRVLTKPSKGVKNDGYDNEESDYILYVNDILGSEETNHKNRYLILDVLGQGTFGQVVKCQNLKTQEVVAVKVVKNKTAYFNQSMMEVSVLDLLNGRMDKNDDHHILRLKDTFIHRQHLCLVFELLSVNLYELIKQNQFRGLSTTLVRVFAQQLLNGLCLLSKAKLIHCDLKPENILLKNLESPIIKIIDFGSACDERQTVYTYIQSRFYRSPEVLLGLPYSAAIDMWSLGCIVVELFLGLPLFPGSSEYNQVSRIHEMLGLPPNWMLEVGKQSGEFFEKVHDDFGRRTYKLKSMEQYSREHGTKEQPSKKYFQQTKLDDIIRSYPMPRKGMKPSEMEREMANREAFIDFVYGLLNINPLERWSPQQARTHPFITQQKFTGPFQPHTSLKTSSRSPAPGVQQQQQAEALSKQRAQAQAVQVQQQAANAAAYSMHLTPGVPSYPTTPQQMQQPAGGYAGMYSPAHSVAPPPYPSAPSTNAYNQPIPIIQQPPPTLNPYAAQQQQQQQQQQSMYTQSAGRNPAAAAGRPRASTMDNNNPNGIPAALQRVVSHLDPNAPIRLQPSPAYYPPPQEGQPASEVNTIGRRRTSRAGASGNPQQRHGQDPAQNRNFVRMLEDRTLEEGWNGGGHGGWPGA